MASDHPALLLELGDANFNARESIRCIDHSAESIGARAIEIRPRKIGHARGCARREDVTQVRHGETQHGHRQRVVAARLGEAFETRECLAAGEGIRLIDLRKAARKRATVAESSSSAPDDRRVGLRERAARITTRRKRVRGVLLQGLGQLLGIHQPEIEAPRLRYISQRVRGESAPVPFVDRRSQRGPAERLTERNIESGETDSGRNPPVIVTEWIAVERLESVKCLIERDRHTRVVARLKSFAVSIPQRAQRRACEEPWTRALRR